MASTQIAASNFVPSEIGDEEESKVKLVEPPSADVVGISTVDDFPSFVDAADADADTDAESESLSNSHLNPFAVSFIPSFETSIEALLSQPKEENELVEDLERAIELKAGDDGVDAGTETEKSTAGEGIPFEAKEAKAEKLEPSIETLDVAEESASSRNDGSGMRI